MHIGQVALMTDEEPVEHRSTWVSVLVSWIRNKKCSLSLSTTKE
jgi:hypothetical protein